MFLKRIIGKNAEKRGFYMDSVIFQKNSVTFAEAGGAKSSVLNFKGRAARRKIDLKLILF